MEGYQQGRGENGVKSIANKKHNWYKIDRGRLRIVEEVKELICTTYGHELRAGNAEGKVGYKVEGDKGEKKTEQLE